MLMAIGKRSAMKNSMLPKIDPVISRGVMRVTPW